MAPLMLLAALFAVLPGCGHPAGEIFTPLPQPLVFPPAPETPRIRYVGQLALASDLKPAVGFGEALGQLLFGKNDNFSMLTPYALCTDGGERLFVADSNAQLVHVFDLNSRKYARWMLPGEKQPHTRNFTQPVGVAFDPVGKRLFVSDSIAQSVVVFDDAGNFQAEWREAPGFKRPTGIAFDPTSRRLFVADTLAHQIVVMSEGGEVLQRLGKRGENPGEFNFPTNVTVDRAGRLYVCDALNWRVQQFDANLKHPQVIGGKGDAPGYFSQPKGIATDSEGHLYVLDAHFEATQIFDREGQLLLSFGSEGRNPGQFWLPTGIFIDPKDRIWIADSYNRRVQVFDYLRTAESAPLTRPATAPVAILPAGPGPGASVSNVVPVPPSIRKEAQP